MKHLLSYGTTSALLGLLVLGGSTGCSSENSTSPGQPETQAEATKELGELAMSLVSTSPDGVRYRLRDATFEVTNYYSYGVNDGGSPAPQTLSSETDPDASTIDLSLEQGYYYVYLRPGWHMERINMDGSVENVSANLLSSDYQYLYIYPHSTNWAGYEFGIGSRKQWFNGDAKINITVYDDPDQYYGGPSPSVFGSSSVPVASSFAVGSASASATPAPSGS